MSISSPNFGCAHRQTQDVWYIKTLVRPPLPILTLLTAPKVAAVWTFDTVHQALISHTGEYGTKGPISPLRHF